MLLDPLAISIGDEKMDGKGHMRNRNSRSSSGTRKSKRGKGRSNLNGFERAAVYNKCNARWSHIRHHTSVVYSDAYKFTFLDNVKAGSTTIRGLIGHSLGVSWFKPRDHQPGQQASSAAIAFGGKTYDEIRAFEEGSEFKRLLRHTTTDYMLAQLNATFKFSMARDPVAKFESGVRQAWVQNKELANLTADELLDKQLSMPSGAFLNEHLQPTTFHLSGWAKLKQAGRGSWRASGWSARGYGAMSVDFIGALESFDEDWQDVVDRFSGLSKQQKYHLLQTQFSNSRHDVEGRSRLSDAAVRRMCRSETYGDEWRCLGYPSPC